MAHLPGCYSKDAKESVECQFDKCDYCALMTAAEASRKVREIFHKL